ncbi:LolA family protein [Desulfomonile tiedjei]|uniref:Outer membrane lipoprotein-sorting protein n=1 Tax=Desulfomonile tiedjei (strain ATCC 49306 / DSM 6799 / DCB-1) TaxID=706587 RepID=I4C2L4_DESTA|nr:outer membrane lipoprotein carrier protein LolA [Desulfomonile tiedjei]AFM23805.1 outer membrane lipoprotein-sorting protein [Desulfomonile tiedjei DSM 6799]
MRGLIAGLALWLLFGQGIASAQDRPAAIDQIVGKLQEVYSHHCCFKARFDQLTVNTAMDLRDKFQGVMFVKKPGSISLEVDFPEPQKVVVKGKTYAIYFPQDGTSANGEIPPEMNVEQFFGFFTNIGNLGRNFTITFPPKALDKEENMYFLELTDAVNPSSTYRMVLGIDAAKFTVKRAIIYDALGNYNRFDLTDFTFLDSLPDSRFEISSAPLHKLPPAQGFYGNREKQ